MLVFTQIMKCSEEREREIKIERGTDSEKVR